MPRTWNRTDTNGVKDRKTRDIFIKIDEYLIDVDKRLTMLSGGAQGAFSQVITPSATELGVPIVSQSFVMVATDNTLLAERSLAVSSGLTMTDAGAKGDLTLGLSPYGIFTTVNTDYLTVNLASGLLGDTTIGALGAGSLTVGTNIRFDAGGVYTVGWPTEPAYVVYTNGLEGACRITPALTFGTTNVKGANFGFIPADSTIALFDAVAPADDAATAVHGASLFASDSAHVHRFPTSLMEYVHSDTLTLTSDGTDLSLTPSLTLPDVILQNAGFVIDGPMYIGTGGTTTYANRMLVVESKRSLNTRNTAIDASLILDAPVGNIGASAFNSSIIIQDGYTNSAGFATILPLSYDTQGWSGPAQATTPIGLTYMLMRGYGSGNDVWTTAMPTIVGLQIRDLSVETVPATTVVGIDIAATGGSLAATTTVYGIRVNNLVTATNKFAASFGSGMTQIVGTQKLGLGQAQGTLSTLYLKAKTSTGTSIMLGSAGADILEFASAAVFPVVNGALGLGQDNNGWLDAWFKDTSAAFEDRVVFTSSTALTADRTLTVDMVNASSTLKISGNATLNQDVSTAGTPQFARAGIGVAADGTELVKLADPANIILGTTTGTKIGTANTQKIGFWGTTPVVRAAAYTPTNVNADRSYDANATSIDELADVVGTLIADLQAYGLLA